MLPRFIAKGAVNSFYFYDYDRQGWVTNEPTIAMIPTIPDDENVAREIARLLHPEPTQIEPKLYHEQAHHHNEEQLAFYQSGVVEEPAPTPPEPPLRRRI